MNCQRIQGHFLDYQENLLTEGDTAAVQSHLKTCLVCQREWAGLQETLLKLERLPTVPPSPQLRLRFEAMLEEEEESLSARSPFVLARSWLDSVLAALLPSRPIWQGSLALLLLTCGLLVGFYWIPRNAPTATLTDATVREEISQLKAKVDSMAQLVAFSALQQQSGNQRLRHVVASLDVSQADERTLSELLTTLAFDPSANVRLCALEALFPHAHRDAVRAGILAALPGERSPLVQVAMIDFVAAARDQAAGPALEELSRSQTIDQAVREAAHRALVQL
ncbi:MAG TPA: hypothetical protein PLN52_18360 [Opitutaceae bacterium]|nr:hypothetical protein [Opitutaceae bacterium]